MLSKKISTLLLGCCFVVASACAANASILEYSQTLALGGSSATIWFTIDTDQGYKDSGLSMHSDTYDSLFEISLEVDGTTYSTDVFTWTDAYPSVTLNASDWSINGIDLWVYSSSSTLFEIDSNSGSTKLTEIMDYSALDPNNDGIIEEDEIPVIINGDGTTSLDSVAIAAVVNADGNTSSVVDTGDWAVSEVPEPGTFVLLSLGLFSIVGIYRKQS